MQSPPEEEPAAPLSDTGTRFSGMETPLEPEASSMWEWGSLLDFNVDDQLNISWSPDYQSIGQSNEETLTESMTSRGEGEGGGGSDSSDRIRKRDPRLTCENFLAGIVPCACPELDEKMEEEGRIEKKRARTGSLGIVRCQVPGCEIDISELKGYHRRHRVCLACANASAVVLEGQTKRYCQQCGKFHILSDFDEGKRSCRRKLERHNKRRRRKPTDFKGELEKESSGDMPTQDLACDSEARKDNSSNHKVDEALLESEDGHVSPLSPVPSSQDIRSDTVTSLATSPEAQKEQGKENSVSALSSSFGDNKSAYSSMCPTGRISFKLYDWNPAEFPRRLRHQIFQWLSSMPVELEGYIRPGCTILTVFIAMPRFMWDKLSEDAASYVHEFVSAPEYMLFGRGSLIVYLNEKIFRVLKGGAFLANVKMEMKAPRLHYVHPICFEAGKPMEFVACGSNLLQPKFRFLVSFAGKYLAYDHCLAISHGKTESCHDNEVNRAQSCDHQIYKIFIPKTDSEVFGPAFIEVENESGLSNFIPVLFGDRQTCSEMQMLEQRFDKSLYSKGPQLADFNAVSESCKVFVPRQASMSELLLDIAWLLKEPQLEERVFSSAEIQRLNYLLGFLIQNESTVLLEKILRCLEILMDAKKLFSPVSKTNDADMSLFQNYMVSARELVCQRFRHKGKLVQHPDSSFTKDSFSHNNSENDTLYEVPSISQDMEMAMEKRLGSLLTSDFSESSETVPLINKDIVMNVNHQQNNLMMKILPRKSCSRIISSTMMSTRPIVLIIAVAALCSGICAVILHPHKVGELAITIRRCLFHNSNP